MSTPPTPSALRSVANVTCSHPRSHLSSFNASRGGNVPDNDFLPRIAQHRSENLVVATLTRGRVLLSDRAGRRKNSTMMHQWVGVGSAREGGGALWVGCRCYPRGVTPGGEHVGFGSTPKKCFKFYTRG